MKTRFPKNGIGPMLLVLSLRICALDNGLALTPPMGWNPWSEFKSGITEAVFREIADSMVAKGLLKAGYVYMTQDGGGRYTNNAVLGQWLHSKGFKYGVYGNNVNYTTPESVWVARWAANGADFVKWDAYNSTWNHQTFTKMRDLLAATGRKIVYSAHCGPEIVNTTIPTVANMWRTTPDIYIPWEDPQSAWNKIVTYINQNNGHAAYAKPGYWNDPDFLLVGLTDGWTANVQGFSYEQNKTHFSLWCISAAPLIIGTDVRDLKKENVEILTNAEAIAVNQDSLGYQGRKVRRNTTDNTEIWSKNLKNGDKAVLLVNLSTTAKSITVRWADAGLSGNVKVRDLWAHRDLGTIADSMTLPDVPGHGCEMYRISGQSVGTRGPVPAGLIIATPDASCGLVHPLQRSVTSSREQGVRFYDLEGRSIGRPSLRSGADALFLLVRRPGEAGTSPF